MSKPVIVQVCQVPVNIKYAVNDEAYARMMGKLQSGEPFVKSYLGTCPHRSPRFCKCPFNKNVLVGNEIMREVDGKMEKVWSFSQITALMVRD